MDVIPDQLSVQINDSESRAISTRDNQFKNVSNEQLYLSKADSSAIRRLEIEDESHSITAMDSQVETTNGIEQSGSMLSQFILPQDHDWNNPCFSGAGGEEFIGLDPSTLFQQGWRTFG
jgi:hypothetical protein